MTFVRLEEDYLYIIGGKNKVPFTTFNLSKKKLLMSIDNHETKATEIEYSDLVQDLIFHTAILHYNSLYIYGGLYYNEDFEISTKFFSIQKNNIKSAHIIQNNLKGLFGHSCGILNDSIIIFGGAMFDPDQNFITTNSFIEYDPENHNFHPVKASNKIQSRYFHSSVVAKNKLFVFGEISLEKSGSTLKETLLSDLAMFSYGSWTTISKNSIPSAVMIKFPQTPNYGHSIAYSDRSIVLYSGTNDLKSSVLKPTNLNTRKSSEKEKIVKETMKKPFPNYIMTHWKDSKIFASFYEGEMYFYSFGGIHPKSFHSIYQNIHQQSKIIYEKRLQKFFYLKPILAKGKHESLATLENPFQEKVNNSPIFVNHVLPYLTTKEYLGFSTSCVDLHNSFLQTPTKFVYTMKNHHLKKTMPNIYYLDHSKVSLNNSDFKKFPNLISMKLSPEQAQKHPEIYKRYCLEPKKIVLLGNNNSGKTCFLNHVKLINGENLDIHKKDIMKLLTETLIKVYVYAKEKEFQFLDKENEKNMHYISLNSFKTVFDEKDSLKLKSVWKDPNLQKIYPIIQHQHQIFEGFSTLMNKIESIVKGEIKKSDYLLLKMKDYEISTYQLRNAKFLDFNGNPGFRLRYYEELECTDLLFFVSIIEYIDINALKETINLFETAINSKLYKKTKIHLLFTKIDLFADKIDKIPLESIFFDYKGVNLGDAKSFICDLFLSKDRAMISKIHVHFLSNYDQKNVKDTLDHIFLF